MGRDRFVSNLSGLWDGPICRGEVWVSPGVLESQGMPNDAAGVARLAASLGADFCFVGCSGAQAVPACPEALLETVGAVRHSDLACGVVIGGPWQRLVQVHGLLALLQRVATQLPQIEHELAVQAGLLTSA